MGSENISTSADVTDELQELSEVEQLELQDLKKKSVSGALSYFGRTIFLNIIGFVASVVLSWYFNPEDFAVYGYVLQFIGLLVFFSDIGLAASLIQKKEQPTLKDYRTAFTTQQILAWFIFLATLLIIKSGIVTQSVGSSGNWILLSLGISFPLASFKTISAIKLERHLDFSKLVIPQILEQIAFNLILIFMAMSHFGVISYAYAILARSLIGAVAMFAIKPWKIGLSFDKKSFKNLFHFGAKFQLNDLLARIKDNLFYIVLIRFMSPTQYGYIQWAKTWSMYPYNMTVNNVMAITFPTFSRLQHNKKALGTAIEKSLFFITLVIFPMIVGMSFFIGPVTMVFSQFSKWQPAVFSFSLFTLGIAFAAISSPLVNTLNAIGKINQSLYLMLMWTALTWTVTPYFLFKFGFNGVAMSAILIAFTSVIPIYLVKKVVTINVWNQISRQLVFAVIMAFIAYMGREFWSLGIKNLLAGMLLVSASYGSLWLLFGRDKLFAEIKSLSNK